MRSTTIGAGIWLLLSTSAGLATGATGKPASPAATEIRAAINGPVTIAVQGVCPDDGHMCEGGGYAIQFQALVDTGNFQTLALSEIRRDGLSASPADSPSVRGLDGLTPPWSQSLIMYWIPAAGEAGVWEFCFEAQNDLGAADTLCAVVDVASPDPDHLAWEPGEFRYHEGADPFDVELGLSTYHSSDSVLGFYLRFAVRERSGSAFFAVPLDSGDFVFPPEYDNLNGGSGPFDEHSDAVSPDTIVITRYAYGPYALLLGGPHTTSVSATLRALPGIMAIDSISPYNIGNVFYPYEGHVNPSFSPGCFAVTAGPPCSIALTGDADHNGSHTSADIIWLLKFVFTSGAPPEPCVSAGDVNCDGAVNSSDIIYTVNYIFKGGPAPCDVCTLSPDVWACP